MAAEVSRAGQIYRSRAKHYREALRQQTSAKDMNVMFLFDHFGMSEWLKVHNSLEAVVQIESFEPGDHEQQLN